MSLHIAGVDGCKNGWIAALQLVEGPPCFRLYKSIQDLLDIKILTRIAIDIPIGLPDRMLKGGRKAEQEARKLLGKYHSRVFSTPCRTVVYTEKYEDACKTAHKYSDDSDDPIGISQQAFSICPKIRELDNLLCASPQERRRIVECHPEVSFCLMNKCVPIAHSKKTKGGERSTT